MSAVRMLNVESAPKIWIDYTNHRGERAWREICGMGAPFLSTNENQYHKEGTFLLPAWDVAKDAWRYFALESIHQFRESSPPCEKHDWVTGSGMNTWCSNCGAS